MPRKPKDIARKDWDDVESPELTAKDFKRMKPAAEAAPHLVEAYRRARGPQKAAKKVPTSLRLDADVREYFEKGGKGWQTRLNQTLRDAIFKPPSAKPGRRAAKDSRSKKAS